MTNACTSVAGRARPGELMRLVAGGLTANGFDVRPPQYRRGTRWSIGCQGARCALSVSDFGDAEWEYSPRVGRAADPELIAGLVAALLTGQVHGYPREGNGDSRDGITFKGIVGLELKTRGFDVDLEIYEDPDYFQAWAEIAVTNPGSTQDAIVYVADDGSITWTRGYWAEATAANSGPEFRQWITDPETVAGDIVATITRAMSQIPPSSPVSGIARTRPLRATAHGS